MNHRIHGLPIQIRGAEIMTVNFKQYALLVSHKDSSEKALEIFLRNISIIFQNNKLTHSLIGNSKTDTEKFLVFSIADPDSLIQEAVDEVKRIGLVQNCILVETEKKLGANSEMVLLITTRNKREMFLQHLDNTIILRVEPLVMMKNNE